MRQLLLRLPLASVSAVAQAAHEETTLFAVRVARPDGTRLGPGELDRVLQVSVHGHDELGWPVTLYPSSEPTAPQRPR